VCVGGKLGDTSLTVNNIQSLYLQQTHFEQISVYNERLSSNFNFLAYKFRCLQFLYNEHCETNHLHSGRFNKVGVVNLCTRSVINCDCEERESFESKRKRGKEWATRLSQDISLGRSSQKGEKADICSEFGIPKSI